MILSQSIARLWKNKRWLIKGLIVAIATVGLPVLAHGQSGQCDSETVDSTYYNDYVEETVCLNADASGLDTYVEVDLEQYQQNVIITEVGADSSIYGPSGLVWDSGEQQGYDVQISEWYPSPQVGATYTVYGSYAECDDWSGNGDPYSCDWTGLFYGDSISALVRPTPALNVSTSGTPSSFGQSVAFTASISGGANGEDIYFWIDGSYVAAVPISNGTATLTTASLGVGSHSISAMYGGDANYGGNTSNILSQTVLSTGATTSTTVSLFPASTYTGNPVTAGISVAAQDGGTPTGTVNCGVSGTSQTFSGSLANGKAAWSIPGLTAGSYNVTCNYGGSGQYAASASQPAREAVSSVPQPLWTAEGAMGTARYLQTATLLPNGTVLVAGGNYNGNGDRGAVNTAEIYTPSSTGGTGSFAPTSGNMYEARWLHTATLLTSGPFSGQVLILGGQNINQMADAELYDPSTQLFSQAPHDLNTLRSSHTASSLQDGTILIAGGLTGCNGCGTSFVGPAEIYNPANSTFTSVGSLNVPRYQDTATVLQNGEVLIAGGVNSSNNITSSAELYNPATGTFTTTGSLNVARSQHIAVLLPDGTVLIAGGQDNSGNPLASAEIYNPATGTFSTTGSLGTARFAPGATALKSGKVLVYGGGVNANLPPSVTTTAELYDPSSATFRATTSLNTARYIPAATMMPDGSILAVGGLGASFGILASAEVYMPNDMITGVINPKYIIMGVTYAPPGPLSKVNYTTSNSVGNTSTIKDSFSSTNGIQVSIGGGPSAKAPLVGWFQQSVTGTSSYQFTQASSDSKTITTTGQTSNNWTTPGTPDYFNPVNHDQDIIWLWINPTIVLSVDPTNPAAAPIWNGYGYDACDPANGIDVVGIKVGYLNGHIQDSQSQSILSRQWETTNPNCGNPVYPNGDVPALTATDYATILAADPFSNPSYSIYPAPGSGVTTTSDGRYTQATSTNGTPESIYYLQENPQWSQSYTQQYANTNTQATTSTQTSMVSWSVAEQFQGSFFVATVTYKLTYSGSVSIGHEVDTSITNTTTNTDQATISGPTCSSNPCSPSYSGVAPSQPSLFDVYQDNLYGSFLFYGVN